MVMITREIEKLVFLEAGDPRSDVLKI
jgi:hypothetical protein